MKSNYVDEDVATMVSSCLNILKIFKVVQLNAIMPRDFDFTLVADVDELYYTYDVNILENLECIFDTGKIELHEVNNVFDPISEYFPEIVESIDYEMELSVDGICIKHEAIVEFFKECKKFNVDVESTLFFDYIRLANMEISCEGYYESYMEIFIPDNLEVREEYGLCIFFTDVTLFASGMIEEYYNAINFCDEIVCENIQDREQFIERVVKGVRSTN